MLYKTKIDYLRGLAVTLNRVAYIRCKGSGDSGCKWDPFFSFGIMAASKTKTNSNITWTFFSSVNLTIFLLISLAITSILGTIIPQQEGAAEFAQKLSPGLFRLFSFLQLFDMYHSIWFRIIIGLLALNLIVCSLDRFPTTWKRFKTSPRPDRSKPFENIPSERAFTSQIDLKAASALLHERLGRQLKKLKSTETDEGLYFYGEKGRYSYFGYYLVHLSVLFIILGGIVGSFFGFEAFVNIPEGDYVNSVRFRTGGGIKSLDFEVKCNRFFVDFYPDGTPKEYRSNLTFFVDGKEALKGSLEVNHPITFRGITFYQSSYGQIPGNKATIRISKQGAHPVSMVMELGKPVPLPESGGEFQLADIRPDFMQLGPAVLIVIKPTAGKERRIWIFRNYDTIKERFPGFFEKFPQLNPAAFAPYVFFLDQIEKKYYTGLQVNRDPGVSLIWIGCFMMVAGFFVAFFQSHRGFYVRAIPTTKGVRISVAGRANKNPVGLERELDQLTLKLRNVFLT
jgi:cytochrome c biogenesis protein